MVWVGLRVSVRVGDWLWLRVANTVPLGEYEGDLVGLHVCCAESVAVAVAVPVGVKLRVVERVRLGTGVLEDVTLGETLPV